MQSSELLIIRREERRDPESRDFSRNDFGERERGSWVIKMKDEWAIVLDFLPHGHPMQPRPQAVAQAIGEQFFNLLEVVPREGVTLKVGERIYIGPDRREKVSAVRGKITLDRLTTSARSELEHVLKELIDKNESRFLRFFNESESVTTKLHQLELLPGIGKKHMWQILDERKKKRFESFEDLKTRVPLLPDPKKAIVKRIMDELGGKEKWYVFVAPPREREF